MILLANKPSGRTSNDVVQYLKFFTKSKKCGHAGTLDPMATGLMILATDDDTKKLQELTGKDKSYVATIDLSKMSDTRDMEYREQFIQYECDSTGLQINGEHKARPSVETVHQHLQSIIRTPQKGVPTITQQIASLPIPPFSAKKINGKKRYDMARSGSQEVVMQEMKIVDIQIISYTAPLLQIACHVGSGTYIRSIAYWLGQQLGTGGILTSLERTSIGDYKLSQIIHTDTNSKISFIALSDNE